MADLSITVNKNRQEQLGNDSDELRKFIEQGSPVQAMPVSAGKHPLKTGIAAFFRISAFVLALQSLFPAKASADGIIDLFERGEPPFDTRSVFFPNWLAVPTASFVIQECEDAQCTECTSSSIISLTVLNFGSAGHADISNVYFALVCGSKHNTGLLPMAPAGVWDTGSALRAAWTWNGAYLFASNADTCLDPALGCSCQVSLFLYVDVSACPNDGATVQLGMPPGALMDDCGYAGPPDIGPDTDDVKDGKVKEIRYVMKTVDREEAVPGDTVLYTVYVGNPGATPSQVVLVDTIPLYMHFVLGSDVPSADPGFNPYFGTYVMLRWTLPAPATTIGGATGVVSFSATVDWGNENDPQAGTVGAPEGARLWNTAQGFWPQSSCPEKVFTSLPVGFVVSRFLFWKIGDNDLLFAGDPAQREEDFMEYEIFIKNKSDKKTWWDVTLWDTVPEGLDPWWTGCGLDDDCIGYTMTPTGCARANAGAVKTGATTIMTWRMDLVPAMTQVLKWRARVRPTTTAGTMVRNQVAIRAYGKPWIPDDGTGDSRVPALFTHQAMVVLRTTYFSYTSFAAADGDEPGFFIVFFPLNINTNFQLYKLEYYANAPFTMTGGNSASINTLVASCDNMKDADGGGLSVSGCGPRRKPAIYWPQIWNDVVEPYAAYAFIFYYKTVTNSPFLWMNMTEFSVVNQDACTYVPSTSLNYRGFMHYTLCRVLQGDLNTPGMGDRLVVINTNMDINNNYQPNLPTTLHFFKWSWGNPLGWTYLKTTSLDSESAFMPFEGTYGLSDSDNSIYRIISSQSQNVIFQGCTCYGAPPHISGAFDNYGTIVPNRENGNLISTPGETANFYCLLSPNKWVPNCVIGNVGTTDATYRIYQYMPRNTAVPDENWPTTLAGSSGSYVYKTTHTVPAGFSTPGNPHVYGDAKDGLDPTMNNSVNYLTLWKVELVNGGPVQVHAGGFIHSRWSGGSNLHSVDGRPSGTEFWYFVGTQEDFACDFVNPSADTFIISTFVPKKDVAVRFESSEGLDWIYTTDGPDQAIAWMRFTTVGYPTKYRMTVDPSGVQASMITQFQQCMYTEKFLTAPFVETGIHYKIYAPAVAYSGQSFWMTVEVVGPGGGIETSYCGNTYFTSSDSQAVFQENPYLWKSAACPENGSPYDDGIRIFLNVVFHALGPQTIVGIDETDGSVTGLTSVFVVGAAVNLTKEPRLATAASGDTVQFKICWSNYSSATAFDLTITDAVPTGTKLVPGLVNTDMICGIDAGVQVDVAYSMDTTPTIPAVFNAASPGIPSDARWLRWTVRHAGVMSSGCVCFKVSIF